MIISRTPVRLSFFGGGTDYPDYFEREGGAVLGTTIDKYIYVSVNRLSEFFDYKIRVGYSRAELVNAVEEIIHPSVRETLKHKKLGGNLDIHIFADLPARTGLGSSSSFTVGLLKALHALNNVETTKQALAEEAIHIEHKLIKENVGCQDQMHAAHGGLNVIEFSGEKFSLRPVSISKDKKEHLNASLMVFYTGLTRFASDILKEQIENTRARSKDVYLKRMHEMVFEAEKIITSEPKSGMVEALGRLLNESWELKKSLSSRITNDYINECYEKAINAGAFGGKLAGAGGGGFLFFLVPIDKKEAVKQALGDLLEVTFNFEDQGSKIIYTLGGDQ
jgi:D-glycero-alpha-D-manno-heptose-7-phosphate kinase